MEIETGNMSRTRRPLLNFSIYILHFTFITILTLLTSAPVTADADDGPKKIVLIAGKKSHGPEGNGIHDYPWSVKLLKVLLDNSNVKDRVRVEFHLEPVSRGNHIGWQSRNRTPARHRLWRSAFPGPPA